MKAWSLMQQCSEVVGSWNTTGSEGSNLTDGLVHQLVYILMGYCKEVETLESGVQVDEASHRGCGLKGVFVPSPLHPSPSPSPLPGHHDLSGFSLPCTLP
jgi:hypothetical protein